MSGGRVQDQSWSPAGARWYDYVLGGLMIAVLWPAAALLRIVRGPGAWERDRDE